MFSFDEYVREIKLGLLVVADHIRRLRGESAASEFIGFQVEGELSEASPDKVNLEQFGSGLAWLLMYNFAFGNPAFFGHMPVGPSDDFEESALASFIAMVPTTWAYGEKSHWPEDPLCQRTLDAFRARRKLDDPTLRETAFFTVRELALLADMTEGAVRNAMSTRDLEFRREGKATVIDWSAAAAWLPKKRGFRPTPTAVSQDDEFPAALDAASSVAEFFAAVVGMASEDIALPRSWRKGTWDGNLLKAVAVARALNLNAEKFAGKLAVLWARDNS
jgi:hypothetical protein